MTGAYDPRTVGLDETCAGSGGSGDADSLTQTSLRAAYATALHELSERLTAATNYVASGLRLSESASTGAANTAQRTEALKKALGQLNRVDDIVISLRKLLSEEGQ